MGARLDQTLLAARGYERLPERERLDRGEDRRDEPEPLLRRPPEERELREDAEPDRLARRVPDRDELPPERELERVERRRRRVPPLR
jgi:hypothetical protein